MSQLMLFCCDVAFVLERGRYPRSSEFRTSISKIAAGRYLKKSYMAMVNIANIVIIPEFIIKQQILM